MVLFNDYIDYCLPPKKPKSRDPRHINEFVVKQKTHCDKLADGKYFIVFGNDACENSIIELINHEYLHASLGLINEDCARKLLDMIWHQYTYKDSIIFKKVLEELSYSGIGYPTRASWIDTVRAFYRKIRSN